MPAQQPSEYAILKAVGHPLRRQLLAILATGEASAKELSDQLGLALPNVSYHVVVLRDLGLLELVRETPKRGATERHYRASPSAPQAAWEVLASPPDDALAEPARVDGRTLVLDARARKEVKAATRRFLSELESIANDSEVRATKRSNPSVVTVAVVASSRGQRPAES
jgi:DNA-binding transcriptional ArsR family regulator